MVDHYLNGILKKQLKNAYVPSSAISLILANIAEKIYGLALYRDDSEALGGVLVTGREEGAFYKPSCQSTSFVVVCIRNSLIETYHAKGPKERISDAQMREITETALRYWADFDIATLYDEQKVNDYYRIINERYPAAWQAFKALGSLETLEADYTGLSAKLDPELFKLVGEADLDDVDPSRNSIKIMDGYSMDFDPMLLATFQALGNRYLELFYTNSFKTISRNYEKLLRVVEFCFYCDSPFVTANYLMQNGHVEKRATLLQPGHRRSGVTNTSNLVPGSRGRHREMLKVIPKGE